MRPRLLRPFCPLLLVAVAAAAGTDEPAMAAGDWDTVTVPPMKSSLVVGSVTLSTGTFTRSGDAYTATYEARVRPWFFASERGRLTIRLGGDALERLARGERIEFAGEAANHRGEPRRVTGQAERVDPAGGRLRVRIAADGFVLKFSGTYRFGRPSPRPGLNRSAATGPPRRPAAGRCSRACTPRSTASGPAPAV